MNTKGSVVVIVIFLSFLTLFTLTDCSTCDISVLNGNRLTFKLTDGTLGNDDRFSITKGKEVIIYKKKKSDKGLWTVIDDKLLELKEPVNKNDSGSYSVEIIDKGGRAVTKIQSVCVKAKVPKPTLNITCQNEKVNFRCDVEVPKDEQTDLSYSWSKNGKEIKKTKENHVENVVASDSKYTCTAHSTVHSNISDPVEATCSKPNTLFGFDFWMMVGILAGGGALVLILIIVLVTFACRACKRKEKHQRDEEEFRLNYLNTTQPSGQQKSKQTARGQPAPPEPYDDVSPHEVPSSEPETRPRTKQRARPPPPPVDDEEEPPPLPQPRKKAQGKNREAPL